jgi:hypothetical protein
MAMPPASSVSASKFLPSSSNQLEEIIKEGKAIIDPGIPAKPLIGIVIPGATISFLQESLCWCFFLVIGKIIVTLVPFPSSL